MKHIAREHIAQLAADEPQICAWSQQHLAKAAQLIWWWKN